ncbi:MAG: ATP-binding protein [Gammaproteobacteria bacterium]|nr:ATP-binding protein [Gammaproteobacteria bacterium]
MASKLLNRISTQLYTSFGGAVVLIIIISLLALFFLNIIGELQRNISEKNVPEMTSAFAIAQQTSALVAAAPRLAASTPEQFETMSATIGWQADAFRAQLSIMMENQKDDERARQIQSGGVGIIENIEQVKVLVKERFDLHQSNLSLRDELQIAQSKLTSILINEIDDQMFYTITGYRSLDETQSSRSAHFSELEFMTYRRLVELREAAAIATQLLAAAFTVMDPALLEPLRERFEATTGSVSRSLDALEDSFLHSRLSLAFDDLLSIGRRENNGFDLRSRELSVNDELSALLNDNQVLGIDVVARVESVVDDSSLVAEEMASQATTVTDTSETLLLIVNIVAISGAILVGWLIVQRRLIRRLSRVSNQMRQMADGNLEFAVKIDGNDEIAQLAKALEVFRNNALEVQRLNLVEMLADELKEKNEELAHTNDELGRAQDQIVMREKLAALGQLTAGVAHEIKNPMNFIMNFSDVSQELLEELLEEVAKNKGDVESEEDYDPELVEEIAEDLTGNLKRISEHGKRANRIVMDMLKMGRGGGEWQPTDLNILLNEHAWLAFHSARAVDTEFQLEIQEDYSPDIVEITVQPQDLGRVFLNLVTNACYATDEKRKTLATATSETPKDSHPMANKLYRARRSSAPAGSARTVYQPTLKLSTHQFEDHIEVHVRDNGNGIPESALERIFNPFYTTKPPDQGTGLGLSMSNDIVRQHGGEFRVNTKEGEFTEMIVALPLKPEAYRTSDTDEGSASEEDDKTAVSL